MNEEIGARICRKREEKNITQQQLAEKIGVSRGKIAKMEVGEREIMHDSCNEICRNHPLKNMGFPAFVQKMQKVHKRKKNKVNLGVKKAG